MVVVGFLVVARQGLVQYVRAVWMVSRLSEERRPGVEKILWGEGYTGFLAYIDVSGSSVWVWGKNGLVRYHSDDYTGLYKYSICNELAMSYIEAQKPYSPGISVTDVMSEWAKWVKPGDYVAIEGGGAPTVRGIRAYDWWVFAPLSVEEIKAQCATR